MKRVCLEAVLKPLVASGFSRGPRRAFYARWGGSRTMGVSKPMVASRTMAVSKPALLTLAGLVIVALAAAGCARDPMTKAQRYVASGDDYAKKNQRDEAIIQYRNAIKAQPEWSEPHYKLAQTYEAAGDHVNAYGQYARAADLDPSNVDAQMRAGTLLLVSGEFADARTRAERALKADPKSAAAHILLGNAHAGLAEPALALRQIEQAINLEPSYAPAWTALGAVKFKGGRRSDAAAAFQKAVELAPQSVDARLALANFQWAGGDVAGAESTLQAALGIDRVELHGAPHPRAPVPEHGPCAIRGAALQGARDGTGRQARADRLLHGTRALGGRTGPYRRPRKINRVGDRTGRAPAPRVAGVRKREESRSAPDPR